MKPLYNLLILCFLILHSRPAYSQGVNEILREYSEAIGGKENFDSIKSYHQSILILSDEGQSRVESYFSKPFKFKYISQTEYSDTSSYYIYNGERLKSNRQSFLSLRSNPFSKRIEEKRMGLLNNIFYRENVFILPNNHSEFNILKSIENELESVFFFDKKTKLLVKEEIWKDGTLINEHEFINYKKFGPIFYPEIVRSTILNFKLTLKTEEIDFNQIYEDSFFENE